MIEVRDNIISVLYIRYIISEKIIMNYLIYPYLIKTNFVKKECC